MSYDLFFRGGASRCQECNAPLSSDDRHAQSAEPLLCLDCQRELGGLLIFRSGKRRKLLVSVKVSV
jgi:hypothetical protein